MTFPSPQQIKDRQHSPAPQHSLFQPHAEPLPKWERFCGLANPRQAEFSEQRMAVFVSISGSRVCDNHNRTQGWPHWRKGGRAVLSCALRGQPHSLFCP